MSKYFTEKQTEKIKLVHYVKTLEKGTLEFRRAKHLYECLGDVEISLDMIKMYFDSFDISKCRYGIKCIQKDTIIGLYEIMQSIPMLTHEALSCISKEYIKDLFDEYSLLDKLREMLLKDGFSDITFEQFMEYVKEKADILDKKYEREASMIKLYFGHYSYNFVTYFEKVLRKQHVTLEQFADFIPDVELILKDEMQLRDIKFRTRSSDSCLPLSYQMYERYLAGDKEIIEFPEQPVYYSSTIDKEYPTTFTKTEFLESIKKRQGKLR